MKRSYMAIWLPQGPKGQTTRREADNMPGELVEEYAEEVLEGGLLMLPPAVPHRRLLRGRQKSGRGCLACMRPVSSWCRMGCLRGQRG